MTFDLDHEGKDVRAGEVNTARIPGTFPPYVSVTIGTLWMHSQSPEQLRRVARACEEAATRLDAAIADAESGDRVMAKGRQ